MSTVILSSVLLVMVASSSLLGFYTRAIVGDAELKSRSLAAAEGCVDTALVALASDQNYTGGEDQNVNEIDHCHVGVVGTLGSYTMFTTEGTSGNAVTKLYIEYDLKTFSVHAWRELPY